MTTAIVVLAQINLFKPIASWKICLIADYYICIRNFYVHLLYSKVQNNVTAIGWAQSSKQNTRIVRIWSVNWIARVNLIQSECFVYQQRKLRKIVVFCVNFILFLLIFSKTFPVTFCNYYTVASAVVCKWRCNFIRSMTLNYNYAYRCFIIL